MEKKIIAIMVSLVVVAAVVVGIVLIAAGGVHTAGGFTKLFDSLEYTGEDSHYQHLELPDDWDAGDEKVVSDMIVDMAYTEQTSYQTTVYITTLYFVYVGENWNDPSWGTSFTVPYEPGWDDYLHIDHGSFYITVSSATNLANEYDIGDTITLKSTIVEIDDGGPLAFGSFTVSGVI